MTQIRIDITPIPYLRQTQGDRKLLRIPEHRMQTTAALNRRRALDRYSTYKSSLQVLAMASKVKAVLDEVLPPMTFVVPMPDSWSEKKKKLMDGTPHRQTPDLDNLLKAFKDAIYPEDKHVHTYNGPINKVWGREGCILIEKP